jgi:small-conductance mechanosensitive channel
VCVCARAQAGNVSGQVQDIGYLQTKILGFDGVPLLVPNQAFTSQVSHNWPLQINVTLIIPFSVCGTNSRKTHTILPNLKICEGWNFF